MLSNDPVNKQLVSGISTISTHLDIKNSPIQGKGLFTTHVLRNGTILFQIVGETFRHEYNPALSDQNPNWIGIGHEQWLQLRPSDIAIYLNHSCNPNVIINEKLELITISLLRPNEELLLD
ncbi:MAG: SET domain-containing protein [Chitinophagaceae bacterium]